MSPCDSLPVLLTGAGPLGAVDHLCYGEAGVEHAAGVERAAAVDDAIVAQHAAAVRRVPGVVAVGPRQQVCHGHEKVVEGDANDHIVIDPNVSGHHHHAVAHA